MADRRSIEPTDATRGSRTSSGQQTDEPSREVYPAAVRPCLTAIDVFAGAGGLSLGFEQAGFVPVLGVDSDPRAMMAYSTNFPDAALVADVGSISGGDLLDASGLDSCTVLIGGPPCAAFSVGGLGRRDDERRGMVAEFARIIHEVNPRYFVMENVPGILMSGAREIAEAFRCDMMRAGYEVDEPWLLDAANFGVPQRRRRVFIVGARRGLRLPTPPKPSGVVAPTTREAIGDLETLENRLPGPSGEHDGELGPASAYALRLRGEAPDDDNQARPRPLPMTLTGCGRVRHTPAVQRRFQKVNPGTSEPISRFLRLHPDRPAPTIRAGTLPDRGSYTAPRPIHYTLPRCITVREAARLQSMPDWFQVDHTKWRGYMQVGNAVPPLLARAVAGAIRRAVNEEETARP